MADNKENRILKSSIEREQSQTCLNSAESEKIKGSTNLNVPLLRFPEFSGEWEECELEDCVDFLDGLRKPIKSEDRKCEMGLYPYYGASGIIDYIDEYIFDGDYILLSEDGANILDRNYRVAFLAKGKIWVNNHAHVLLPHTNIDIDFLSEALERLNYAVYNTGTTMPKLNQEVCRTIGLYIPPIKEQNKIGALLSLLNERIATQNKIIDKLQSLIKGISSRIFASIQGIEYRMGDIVTITNGNSNVQDAVTQSKDGLYPFFDRSEDIKYLPTFLFDKEAIIYPGEGTEFMPRYFKGKFALHQRCYAIFDFNEIINARFLYFYLKTRNSYFVKNAVGSTVPSLRLDTFQKLKVIIPPKKAQHSVSSCLSSMEQKCNVEKKILHKLLKQKQYLLRQMFI